VGIEKRDGAAIHDISYASQVGGTAQLRGTSSLAITSIRSARAFSASLLCCSAVDRTRF
jgi:hypothetical protein